MKVSLVSSIITPVCVISAYKNDETPTTKPTTADLIIGKWKQVKEINWITRQGVEITKDSFTDFRSGEYVDFRTDGYVYVGTWGAQTFSIDTLLYSIDGNVLTTNPSPYETFTAIIEDISLNNLNFYEKLEDANRTIETWSFYTKY